MKNKIKGFTLMEMLIVVAIIAILIAIAIPVFNTQLQKARETTAIANAVSTVHTAAVLHMSSGEAPTADEIAEVVGTEAGLAHDIVHNALEDISYMLYEDFGTELFVEFDTGMYSIVDSDETSSQISSSSMTSLQNYFTKQAELGYSPQGTRANYHTAMFEAAGITPGTYFTDEDENTTFYVNVDVQNGGESDYKERTYYPIIFATDQEVAVVNSDGQTPGISESQASASYIYYGDSWYKGSRSTNIYGIGKSGITSINDTLEAASTNATGTATSSDDITYTKVNITLIEPKTT